MLLLLTIGLVLVATVALVIGFVTNALPPIYVSIACSVAAALVLLLFSRLSKREVPAGVGGGPAPLPGPTVTDEEAPGDASNVTVLGSVPSAPPEPATEQLSPVTDEPMPDEAFAPEGALAPPEAAGTSPETAAETAAETAGVDGVTAADMPSEPPLAPAEPPAAPPAWATAEAAEEEPEPVEEAEAAADTVTAAEAEAAPGAGEGEEDVIFPIADYDDLRVSEILPLLPELDEDELQMVRDREQEGRARFSILTRVDQLLVQLGSASAAPPVVAAPTQGFEEDASGVGVPSAPVAARDAEPADQGAPAAYAESLADDAATSEALDAVDVEPAGVTDDADLAEVQDAAAAPFAPEATPAPAPADEAEPEAAPSPADVEPAFPIADYEGRKVTEILPLLTNMGADDLARVLDREQSGKKRGSVLARIEQLQARAAGGPSATKEPADKESTKKAPAKKAATGSAKKAPAKTAAASAKKAAPSKGAAKATKTPAKKAPSRSTKKQ